MLAKFLLSSSLCQFFLNFSSNGMLESPLWKARFLQILFCPWVSVHVSFPSFSQTMAKESGKGAGSIGSVECREVCLPITGCTRG